MNRKARAATMASSSCPAIGTKSGMRSIGDASHRLAIPTTIFARSGTRGSRRSPPNIRTRFGTSSASSRASSTRPTMTRTIATTIQIATRMRRISAQSGRSISLVRDRPLREGCRDRARRGDGVVERAQRGTVGRSTFREPPRPDVDDLEHSGEITRCLGRPRAVPADLGLGVRRCEIAVLHHEVDRLVECHLLHVQRGVDDDPRGTEQRRLVLEQQVAGIRKETLLAHDALGVQTPTLGEIRREVGPANGRAVLLGHHEMPMVAWVCLVYGGRRDPRAAVALEAFLHLFGWRAIRRIRHEKMSVEGIAERRRLVVARDCLDRTLVVRRWLDRATLARGERDESSAHEKRSGALGPVLVLRAHRVGSLGVYVVQALADLRPRPAAVDLLSDLVRLAREKVVLFASAFAEPARVKGKELLLAEQSRVELLADRVVAARAGSVGLEECREVLVRAGGRRARFGDLLPKRRILHLSRHE